MRTSGIVIAVILVLALVGLIIFNPFDCNGDSQAKRELESLKKELAEKELFAQAKARTDSLAADSIRQAQLLDSLAYYKEIAKGCMPKPKKEEVQVKIVYRDRLVVEQKKESYVSPYVPNVPNVPKETPIYPTAPRSNVREVQEVIDFCIMYDLEEGWHAPHLWKNAGWNDYSTGEVVANPKNDGYNFRIHSSQRTSGFVGRWGQTTDGTYFLSAQEVDSKSPCNKCKVYLKCSENVWTPELMSLSSDGLYYYLLPR